MRRNLSGIFPHQHIKDQDQGRADVLSISPAVDLSLALVQALRVERKLCYWATGAWISRGRIRMMISTKISTTGEIEIWMDARSRVLAYWRTESGEEVGRGEHTIQAEHLNIAFLA